MSANNDPISKSLGLTPIEKNNNTISIMKSDAHNNSARTDFTTARANLLDLIDVIKDAIENLKQISDSSQSPRAYEVLSKLTDSYVQANKDLLELQAQIRTIDAADTPTNAPGSVTNNLFVGSTADLQKVINQLRNE